MGVLFGEILLQGKEIKTCWLISPTNISEIYSFEYFKLNMIKSNKRYEIRNLHTPDIGYDLGSEAKSFIM